MKLSCLQENISRGLAIVGRAVATRTTLPISQQCAACDREGASEAGGHQPGDGDQLLDRR